MTGINNVAAAGLAVLAVWRVTHLLVAEDGPWELFVHLRRTASALRLARLASCFYCASLWIAIPFALLIAADWRTIVICIPGLSGGAVILERLASRGDPAEWFEEKETS